jgi:hypothetical protein
VPKNFRLSSRGSELRASEPLNRIAIGWTKRIP